jgi:hypothetical protein
VEETLDRFEKNYFSLEARLEDVEELEEADQEIEVKAEARDTHINKASQGKQAPSPPPLDFDLMKKTNKEAERKIRIPMAPLLSQDSLKKAQATVEDKKKIQKSIPTPPPINMTSIKRSHERVEENRQRYKQEVSQEKPKKKSSIMDEDEISKLKEKIEQVRKGSPLSQGSSVDHHSDKSSTHSPHHHRQFQILSDKEIHSELLVDDEGHSIKPGPKLDLAEGRVFSFAEEVDNEQEFKPLPQQEVEPIYEEAEEYNTFKPSKPHIIVDDPSIDESEQASKQRFSPRFESDDRDLNQRDEQFEDFKLNRMLVANIDNLEAELQKAHKKITYLEEYNNQLVKSKNDLYLEKENLIKRSIEFEYLQQRLEEKERRMQEIEKDNARRSSEIIGLKKDNENLRQQMDSMIQFIKKLATSRLLQSSNQESSQNNDDFIEAINVFADRLRRSPDYLGEDVASPDFMIQNSQKPQASGNGHIKVNDSQDEHYMTDASPARKIIKKKYKVEPKVRRRIKQQHLDKPPSPLNREQKKLLHDPQSFDRYAKELDIDVVRNVQSGRKKVTKKITK